MKKLITKTNIIIALVVVAIVATCGVGLALNQKTNEVKVEEAKKATKASKEEKVTKKPEATKEDEYEAYLKQIGYSEDSVQKLMNDLGLSKEDAIDSLYGTEAVEKICGSEYKREDSSSTDNNSNTSSKTSNVAVANTSTTTSSSNATTNATSSSNASSSTSTTTNKCNHVWKDVETPEVREMHEYASDGTDITNFSHDQVVAYVNSLEDQRTTVCNILITPAQHLYDKCELCGATR